MDADGDYIAGQGRGEFLVDSREAVGQIVMTRLRLATGEWFLNTDEGTPYSTQILGTGTELLYDAAIRDRILGSPGVIAITDYVSVLDEDRHLHVVAAVETRFGSARVVIQQASAPEGDRLDIDFVLDSSVLL